MSAINPCYMFDVHWTCIVRTHSIKHTVRGNMFHGKLTHHRKTRSHMYASHHHRKTRSHMQVTHPHVMEQMTSLYERIASVLSCMTKRSNLFWAWWNWSACQCLGRCCFLVSEHFSDFWEAVGRNCFSRGWTKPPKPIPLELMFQGLWYNVYLQGVLNSDSCSVILCARSKVSGCALLFRSFSFSLVVSLVTETP